MDDASKTVVTAGDTWSRSPDLDSPPTWRDYLRLLSRFSRNSIARELGFRWNFVVEFLTLAFWFSAQVVLFDVIFGNVRDVNGWSRAEFFTFLATGMIINTLIETFFMPNCANFSELIRSGNLDFALLKPIDTQFLVSFERLNLSELSNLLLAGSLLGYGVWHLDATPTVVQVVLYFVAVLVGVTFYYGLMIALASSSIWFGRNQGLYDFWFYITVFARYPRSIYHGSMTGDVLRLTFTFAMPILLVVSVPAEVITGKLLTFNEFPIVLGLAAVASLVLSRLVFQWALTHYRSASS